MSTAPALVLESELPALAPAIVTLPVAPASNRYWRVWRNRAVRSKEATAYLKAVRAIVGERRLFLGPIAVRLTWYREARRGDLDGRLKVTLDALQGCLYENDNQIVELHAYRRECPAQPRIVVEVEARAP